MTSRKISLIPRAEDSKHGLCLRDLFCPRPMFDSVFLGDFTMSGILEKGTPIFEVPRNSYMTMVCTVTRQGFVK